METLTQIWQRLKDNGYETDKGSIHSYIPVYEELLKPYRETALNVLEIGIFNGASVRMWAEYFTKAHIHGIDCSISPVGGIADLQPLINEIVNSEPYSILFKTHIHIFDAEDIKEVAKRFTGIKFDVIIEDAGHEINQQLNLYKIWSKYLSKGGVYIIEDVQDIQKDESRFWGLMEDGLNISTYDLREQKDRYDDVLIVIK